MVCSKPITLILLAARLLLISPVHAESCNFPEVICDVEIQDVTIQELLGLEFPVESIVCVNMTTNSEELLFSTENVLNFSVVIQGNNSTVTCDNTVSNSSYFPLHFSNSSLVMINELIFEGCTQPLYFKFVQMLKISSSMFRNFYPGGAIEISDSPMICIEDSIFINDTSLGIGQRSFSGNAGGVAIGYSYSSPWPEHIFPVAPQITIIACKFENNRALSAKDFQLTVLEVLSRSIYNQRGGGMALYFGADNYSVVVNIEDCIFIGNEANDSGGGLYMFLNGEDNSHNVTIRSTNFTGNKALDGGGLEISHSNKESLYQPNKVLVTQCRFIANWGNFGGGFKNIQLYNLLNLNYLTIQDSLFEDNVANVGSGLYLQSVDAVKDNRRLKRITLKNCTFRNNEGKRGVIFVISNVIIIIGDTLLENSTGPALRIVGTLVFLKGNIMFRNNRNHPKGFSGALYLSSFGQILLYPGINITFINNTGNEGACIVVKGQLIAAAFKQQLYNPQCFLQYMDPTTPPHNWTVRMRFEENKAKVGPVVYLSDGDVCQWNSLTSPYFSTDLQKTWTFMDIGTNYVNGGANNDSLIQTEAFKLNLITNSTSAFPGEDIKVAVTALDQFNHNTSAFISITPMENTDTISFEPSIVSVSSGEEKIEFKYLGSINGTTTVVLSPYFTQERDSKNFSLQHELCLPGYMFNDETKKCECTETEEVILCQDNLAGLVLANGLYGAPPEWSRDLVTHVCPPKYCYCIGSVNDSIQNEGCQYLYKQPDVICNKRRGGLLCGRCQDQYGVGLLTNNCQKHTHYYWIIIPYVIAVIVTLVVIVKLGLHLPTILRGYIFYVQIAPISVAYFPDSFNVSSTIMSCIASTLAFYLPYDFTLHKGMTSLESYGLRYCAPVLALIVVPIAARVRNHRFKYWHGIWTIVLLMYVMTVETSVSILFCPTLRSKTKSVTVWFFDGTVTCYSGWHLVLSIIALISLVVQALLIPFVAASIYYKILRKKYVKFEQLERFSIVITHGMKQEYRWWPIIDVGCRFIFVTAVVLSPSYVEVPLVLSIVIFVAQIMIHPYESLTANYTESLLYLWLVGLLGLGNTTPLQEVTSGKDAIWLLLYLPLIWGAAVISVYTLIKIRKHFLLNKELIRKKLKMKSLSKLHRRLTVSHSLYKLIGHNDLNVITRTTIALDDIADHDSVTL